MAGRCDLTFNVAVAFGDDANFTGGTTHFTTARMSMGGTVTMSGSGTLDAAAFDVPVAEWLDTGTAARWMAAAR